MRVFKSRPTPRIKWGGLRVADARGSTRFKLRFFPAVPLLQTPRPAMPLIQRPLLQKPWSRLPFGAHFVETALGLWLIDVEAQLV